MSRRSGADARFSKFSRTGVSVLTSAGVYTTDELARDQRGFVPPLDPPLLIRAPPPLTDG